MDEPAFTVENLAKLRQAIASGATRVRYDDKEIYYQKLSDLLVLEQRMMRELGLNNDSGRRFATFSNGL